MLSKRRLIRAPSLVKRLLVASLLILPIVIGFSTYALNRAYVRGLDSAEYEALLSQIYALLAVAEATDSDLTMPSVMANPRFETPDSGLYARIFDVNAQPVWESNSLYNSVLSLPKAEQNQPGYIQEQWFTHDNQLYRSINFNTIWEINGTDQRFHFEIIHSQQAKQKDVRRYRRALLAWLSGMAVILLILQAVITLWGLKPLKKLARQIEDVEQGDNTSLDQDYPIEIQPVTTSLNKLLESEASQRERYKNSLSDLAHSLKTPLSVIRSQLNDNEQGRAVDEQVERMSTIISHQLRRASAEVQTLYGPSTPLHPLISRITNALTKVYADKKMQVEIDVSNTIAVAMSEDDCFEVLGNIIENAFKYGDRRVLITESEQAETVILTVSDDGPGVNNELSSTILERGARADTTKSGQGIGLAIAVDILSSYNGALTTRQSRLGGAAFQLTFPK